MTDVEMHFLLMDPTWEPGPDDEAPPVTAVVGAWPIASDGAVGGFRPNPHFRPGDPEAPADPLDALLRGAAPESPPVELVQLLLRDAVVDVALDPQGTPLVVYSPDDALCLLVATSAPQRDPVPVAGWRRTDLLGLIGLLSDGVDVLVNPYGPVPARIDGDDVRGAWLLPDDVVERARDGLRAHLPARPTAVLPWVINVAG